jgi:hypothetical protein
MARRICQEPYCPRDATSRGRCDECRKRYERERSRARRARAGEGRLYDKKRWHLTRRRYRFENPFCEHVENGKPCGRLAEHVHHRTDLADGGDPYNFENLQALCASHHSRITASRQGPS